jgi:hypothetical protein
MTDDVLADLEKEEFLESLSPEEKDELQLRHFVKSGDDVVWIEPERRVRKEKAAALYYIRTGKGVFRISRLNGEIIEV